MFGNSEYAWKTIPMSRLLGGTLVTSLPSTTMRPARGAFASHEKQRQHRGPRDTEREERERAGGEALRLVDVLDEDREGVERRQVRDRELAHHDCKRQERRRERSRADVREDHAEER